MLIYKIVKWSCVAPRGPHAYFDPFFILNSLGKLFGTFDATIELFNVKIWFAVFSYEFDSWFEHVFSKFLGHVTIKYWQYKYSIPWIMNSKNLEKSQKNWAKFLGNGFAAGNNSQAANMMVHSMVQSHQQPSSILQQSRSPVRTGTLLYFKISEIFAWAKIDLIIFISI